MQHPSSRQLLCPPFSPSPSGPWVSSSHSVSTTPPPYRGQNLTFYADFRDYKVAFAEMYTSNARVLNRMRLTCQSMSTTLCRTNNLGPGNGMLRMEDFTNDGEAVIHAMNEVILHRGKSPHLTLLNISIDGVFLTEAIVSPLPNPQPFLIPSHIPHFSANHPPFNLIPSSKLIPVRQTV
jgi:hypothetical protein